MIVGFDKVSLSYGDDRQVLQDLSFTLNDGEFRFLTGPSGAGKTSLLKMIYLGHKPSGGRLTLFGEDVTNAPREALPPLRRRIGVVFQEFRLLDHLTAFENVALPLRVAGVNHSQYREDVRELLNWVGLGDRVDAYPATLSGGEKQRVALARALVSKPDLILADEPTGNVDPSMGEKIMKLFVELNRLGSAVIVATHDLHLVKALGKPALTIQNGTLVPADYSGFVSTPGSAKASASVGRTKGVSPTSSIRPPTNQRPR
ncbi:MAG: cell division ATP-binding protein FtsE [Pseudomonadota bacterium]